MSSLTLKPTFLLHSYGSSSVGSRRLCSLISFQKKTFRKQKFTLRAQSIDSPQNNNENDNKNFSKTDSKPPNGSMHKSRREILLEYVQNVQPEFMELFVKKAPQQDSPVYASGTQKKVTGEVIRWNNVTGPEKIDALKYIELLEAEVEELNPQMERKSANGYNELLEYLKTLKPQNIKELTSTAGEDVVLAMNAFIKRLLAVSDPSQMKTSVTETSALELAKLLYWLMVVGYNIRNIEVRFDMERVLGTPPKLAELPPGENI